MKKISDLIAKTIPKIWTFLYQPSCHDKIKLQCTNLSANTTAILHSVNSQVC